MNKKSLLILFREISSIGFSKTCITFDRQAKPILQFFLLKCFFYFCTKMAFLFPAATSCGFVWSFWKLWDCQKKVETAIQQLEGHLQQCPQCDSYLEEDVRRELNLEDDGTVDLTGEATTGIAGLPQVGQTIQITSLPQEPQTIYIAGLPHVAQSIQTEATGRVVKNPFFNYLREIRPTMTGRRQTVIAIEGARRWNQLPLEQKCKYGKLNVLQRSSTRLIK